MDKKKKNALKQCEIDIASGSNSAKKRKVSENNDSPTLNIGELSPAQETKKIKKKKKRELSHDDEDSSVTHDRKERTLIRNNKITDETTSDCKSKVTKVKTKKLNNSKGEVQNNLNKKTIFNDDDDMEDVAKVSIETQNKTNLKFLQGEEAEVKEEDIDKFCEEINEEDNAQYENWVKLVEAQLSSSKNKKKSNKT